MSTSNTVGAVILPLSSLLDEFSGHPVEFRFRNRVVGAEADLGMAAGVAGDIAVLNGSCRFAYGGAFRLFDGGLVSVVCGLYPNARPIAATPMVPVAHSDGTASIASLNQTSEVDALAHLCAGATRVASATC